MRRRHVFPSRRGSTSQAASAYGSVAQDLAWRFGHPAQQVHAQFLYAAFVQRWLHPYAWVLPRLRRAYETARKVGEMRSAAYALSAVAIFSFAAGRELDDLLRDLEDDMPFLRKTRNEGIMAFHVCYRQSIRCLKGLTSGRNEFAEPGFDEEAFLRAAEVAPSLVCLYWIRRLYTSFIFRDFVSAHGYAEAAGQLMQSMSGYVPAVDYVPYNSLCLAALCETGPAGKRAEWLAKIAENQRRLACWAESCPVNFRHLYVTVEAEIARIHGRPAEAADLYDEAIEGATEGGFTHDAAVASELAGPSCAGPQADSDRRPLPPQGAREVRSLGRDREGSRARRRVPGDGPLRVREAPRGRRNSRQRSRHPQPPQGRRDDRHRGGPRPAARAPDPRVRRGGRRRPGAWSSFWRKTGSQLRSRDRDVDVGRVALEHTPLSETAFLARHPIEQARMTRRSMVVDEAVHDPRVASDPYVASRAMKSILALPVHRRAGLAATLYFENNLVTHAFTGTRLRVLELLSAQIAGALENSLLFEKLRREVAERRRTEDSVRFLASAGAELAESLDAEEISATLARIVVPALADWCCVDLVDDSRQIRRMVVLHVDPAKSSLAREFREKVVPEWSSPQPPSVVLRSGVPFLLPEASDEVIQGALRDAEHFRLVRALGTRSVALAVPMLAHGRTVGVITCCSDRSRRYGPDDVKIAQELALRAALAVDNAGLFRKAQEAVRVREEFLSIAAHESSTPPSRPCTSWCRPSRAGACQ